MLPKTTSAFHGCSKVTEVNWEGISVPPESTSTLRCHSRAKGVDWRGRNCRQRLKGYAPHPAGWKRQCATFNSAHVLFLPFAASWLKRGWKSHERRLKGSVALLLGLKREHTVFRPACHVCMPCSPAPGWKRQHAKWKEPLQPTTIHQASKQSE